MITASEARQIVDQGKYDKAGKQWNEIELAVSDAIKAGKSIVSLSGCIEVVNRKRLTALGYTVAVSGESQAYFSVSW